MTKGQDGDAHSLQRAGLAGSGLPRHQAPAGRGEHWEGMEEPRCFSAGLWASPAPTHKGSQRQEAPRPGMGPGPAVQGLFQAPSVTRPLKVTYQHHLVGILHASILSRVPENFCKGPGERRAAQPSVCTYKESEIGIVKKKKHQTSASAICPHVAGGLGGSTSPPSPPKGTVRGVAWGWAQGILPAGPAATSGPRGQATQL